uniref:LysM type receptor kinase n=1 Tax=Solanum tuberosum TaxID=4113 RepID=M0ZLP4_SOLTU
MTRVKQILRILQKGDLLIRVLLQRVQRIAVDKSVEFSYDELANASDNFSTAYKIGQGGFASVYYGEFRGEKAATKKMDMQSTKEFLAELKVLAHVHHLNLVRLIGYCIEGSLFLLLSIRIR